MADPTHGDCSPTFSFEQVNGLLHAGIALLYDDSFSVEQNAKNIVAEFLEIEFPSDENGAIVTQLVEQYNELVTEETMGVVSKGFF